MLLFLVGLLAGGSRADVHSAFAARADVIIPIRVEPGRSVFVTEVVAARVAVPRLPNIFVVEIQLAGVAASPFVFTHSLVISALLARRLIFRGEILRRVARSRNVSLLVPFGAISSIAIHRAGPRLSAPLRANAPDEIH